METPATGNPKMFFILQATNALGQNVYYTGRAGVAWVSTDRNEAFQYSHGGAMHRAGLHNPYKALHGLTFQLVDAT